MSSVQAWKHVASPANLTLAVVVLVESILFIGYHRERWTKALVPRTDPQLQMGEALVIRNDGHGYYAWLRSLLIDGDWSFDNEFDEHNPVSDWVPAVDARTEIGRRANPWSVGPACVWAVAVVPAHYCFRALQPFGWPWPADGYSLPYQLLVGTTTLIVSLVGLAFLYGLCRAHASPSVAAFATASITLGTPLVFYNAIEVSMAHGLGAAALAAFVWYWQHTYGTERPRRWIYLGLLLGMTGLIRWQLLTFAVLPAAEAFLLISGGRRLGRVFLGLCLASASTVVALTPQLLAWRLVYGTWLPAPIAASHNWLHPSWFAVLIAQDRGLCYWTPLTLLAAGGCLVACLQHGQRSKLTGLLLLAFGSQVYVLASLWGEGVYLGVAFGFRHLTESLIVLAPGLAVLLQPPARLRWALPICVLMLWNLLLICQYQYGLVPAAGGAEVATLLQNNVRLVARKRWLLVGQVLAGPLLLAIIWRWSERRHGLVFPCKNSYNEWTEGDGLHKEVAVIGR